MLTGTAPSIDSLSFSNPNVSSGSVSGDFAGVLSDSTPGAYYTIEIDTNGDQMPEASGMTGSPGSFSTYGSMPLSTTSVMARAVEMDSTTWQYVYGAWQPFTVNTGVVVNTLPTIASLTFANPSAAYGSVTGQFVGSVTDATPSYSYNIEVDTNGDEVSEFSFGAYSSSFNQSYWLALHITSVNARAVEYDSALGQSVSGGWQTFGINNGVVANTLPTVDGLSFSSSYAAFGFATGFFTGSISDATPSSSSYTIEMYTDMNPVSAIVGSSGAGSFNLMASILVGTTTVVARAKEFVYATGQTVIGDWQSFPIDDGVVANTMPSISSLEFTNPAASWFSVTGLFVGTLTDATPGASYSIEIDTNNDGILDTSAYTTSPGSFSVDGTVPVGISSVRARVIETISATNKLAYGDWQDFPVSSSGSYSSSFVENLVVSLLLGNPNATEADFENALYAYFDSLNLGFSVQSLLSLVQQWIPNSTTPQPNGLSSTTPNSTTPTTPAAVAPAAAAPAAAAPPATNPQALAALTDPIPHSQTFVPSGPISEPAPIGLKFYHHEDAPTRYNYQVFSQYVWDGKLTNTFQTVNGQVQGKFLYNEEVRTITDSRTVHVYSYVDDAVVAAEQAKLDAENAAMPGLNAKVDRYKASQNNLNTLGNLLAISAGKYAILAGLAAVMMPVGTSTPVTSALAILSGIHAIAAGVAYQAAVEKGRLLSAASSAVMAAEGRIGNLKSAVDHGTGLPRLFNTYATDIKTRVTEWTPNDQHREYQWQDCTYCQFSPLGATNQYSQYGFTLLQDVKYWDNIGIDYRIFATD